MDALRDGLRDVRVGGWDDCWKDKEGCING